MIQFFVPGIPKPGGSKRGFYNKKLGRVMIVDASGEKGADWRGDVRAVGMLTYEGKPLDEPVELTVEFIMPRPKGHYWPVNARHQGELREDAPRFHTSAPDATKLVRSLEDALTGILWKNDSCVAFQAVRKVYGEKPGARVTVRRLVEEELKVPISRPDEAGLFAGSGVEADVTAPACV